MDINLSDEQLAEATIRNKEAFNVLVNRYSAKIQRYIARIINNWEESQDLTQDVFLKAYQNIASFNLEMKFSSWLYRIAHNESVNFIKKHYRWKRVEFNDSLKNTLIDSEDSLEHIIQNEDALLIKQAMQKLRPREREVLELFYFEDKKYLEIADILEVSTNSVGPIINRAKEQLRKIIDSLARKNE